MPSEEVEREMAKIPLSGYTFRETINNTLLDFAHNATRNLQTSTINLQFYEATKIGGKAYFFRNLFVSLIRRKYSINLRIAEKNIHVTGVAKAFLIPHLHSWNISNFDGKHVLQSVLKVLEP
jgi:hypothetical protein